MIYYAMYSVYDDKHQEPLCTWGVEDEKSGKIIGYYPIGESNPSFQQAATEHWTLEQFAMYYSRGDFVKVPAPIVSET